MVSWLSQMLSRQLTNFPVRRDESERMRRQWLAHAEGLVLEIGFGSGLNLPYYGSNTRELMALDREFDDSPQFRARMRSVRFPVLFVKAGAQKIPLQDHSVDTVVSTWTLCSVGAIPAVLAEVRRVLKPSGKLIFIEHGLCSQKGRGRLRSLQKVWSPIQQKIADGCRVDHDIRAEIEMAGFQLVDVEEGFVPGCRPMAFFTRGIARLDENPR